MLELHAIVFAFISLELLIIMVRASQTLLYFPKHVQINLIVFDVKMIFDASNLSTQFFQEVFLHSIIAFVELGFFFVYNQI